jgi:hypothetical protein
VTPGNRFAKLATPRPYCFKPGSPGVAKWLCAWFRYNPGMALNDVLSLLDAEIERFKAARAILAAGSMVTAAPRKAGRPPKVQPASPKVPKRKKKRNLTPEGRARIAAAAKRRWATKRRP